MRLTLRTLLAYLDDVLEPSEAKEIGKKVQESPVATALISRIREVIRRRRLGAPDLQGPGVGIDPNLVAQYLDNTLPPEKVAEIERICLESDQQLAEVAACHQILTLALGEPVEITPANRERLYVLGPVEAGEKLQAATEPAHRANGAATPKTPVSVATIPGSAGPSFEETLPDYLKPKPWSRSLIMIAASLVLVAVWIGSLLSDPDFFDNWKGLRNVPASKTARSTPPAESDAESEANVVAAVDVKPKVESDAATPDPKPPQEPAKTDQPEGLVAAIPDDQPADAAPAPAPPDPRPPEPGDAVKPAAAVSVQYVSADGVLLRLNPADRSWYVVPKQSELKPGSILACPEPFEAALVFDQGALHATLLGDTVVEIVAAEELAPVTLRLISGRIILHASRRDQRSWPLGLLIGPQAGVLQFSEFETLCGVEYLPKEPVAYEQAVNPAERVEGMYVLQGAAEWTPQNGQPRLANKGVFLRLLSEQPPLNFGPPGGAIPDWLDPQRRKVGSLLRRFAKQFEKEFDLNLPIDSAMRPLIRDPRARISELSVRCLALCDNYSAVVQALAQAEYEDARKAAMNGLRLWLGADAERGQPLIQALRTYYERDDQVETLYRLLWGISVEEAKTQQASLELVEWLKSDKIEIRELAFANLVRLTNRKYDYRPQGSPAQREPAVKRWYDHVIRDGALIKEE